MCLITRFLMDVALLTTLDRILNSKLAPIISELPGIDQTVQHCLEQNAHQFFSLVRNYGGHIEDHFNAFLKECDELLGQCVPCSNFENLETVDGLTTWVSSISTLRPENNSPGFFLHNDAVQKLLHHHPPHNVIDVSGFKNIDELTTLFSPRGVLAITRHTEDSAWHEKYFKLLASLDTGSFSSGDVQFQVFPRPLIDKASARSGHTLKPWPMSHSKEAGMITCFTGKLNGQFKTPYIFFVLLFFHYYFETLRASHAVQGRASIHPKEVGNHVQSIISSTQRSFPFFNANVHSEALYWEDAIAHVDTVIPQANIRQYIPFLSCGAFLHETDEFPVSLNIIDRLWDQNCPSDNAYFNQDQKLFLYHFRECLWGKILQAIKNVTPVEMKATVLNTLELDDIAFTEHLLGIPFNFCE